MDNNLKVFLTTLSNIELAYFYQYRYDSFLPSSQHKILQELSTRSIKVNRINDIIVSNDFNTQPNPKDENFCPRCRSDRYYVEKGKFTRRFKGFSYENEIDKYFCQVCGYNSKRNKGFKYSTIRYFNKLKLFIQARLLYKLISLLYTLLFFSNYH